MDEFIRVTAKTVEDAITEASIQLGTSSDNIEYHILERGTSGFFGIGGKKAVIEAKKKISDEDLMKEVFADTKPVKKPEKKEVRKELKKEVKKENKEASKELKKEVKKPEKKEVKEAAPVSLEAKPVKIPKTPVDPKEAEAKAIEFLKAVFKTMDTEVEITAEFRDDALEINMDGEEMGVLIGKRGQTLDSLQYLVSLVVNKGKSSYVRVKLDTENYRSRRKATLENLAKNIAFKVKKTRRPVFLEPMNPYERRIIHSALQNDPYVTTHSEGEEPCRKVVVTLKKQERPERTDK